MSDYTILIIFHSNSKYDIFNHHKVKNRQVFQQCFLPMIIQINHKQMHFSHVVMQITALMWSLKVHTKLKTKNRRGMIDTQISAQYCTSHGLASAVKKSCKKRLERGKKSPPTCCGSGNYSPQQEYGKAIIETKGRFYNLSDVFQVKLWQSRTFRKGCVMLN